AGGISAGDVALDQRASQDFLDGCQQLGEPPPTQLQGQVRQIFQRLTCIHITARMCHNPPWNASAKVVPANLPANALTVGGLKISCEASASSVEEAGMLRFGIDCDVARALTDVAHYFARGI